MKQRRPTIAVFGSSRPPPESPEYRLAFELGAAIAEAGWNLCNGGYGGTMEAAAHGAHERGGHTVGVTCRVFGRSGPNTYVCQEVPTFSLLARLDTLARLAHGYVVLPGGTGTLLELALVWELQNKALMKRRAPMVLLGEYWKPLLELIRCGEPGTREPQVAPNVEVAIGLLRAGLYRPRDDVADAAPSAVS